MRNIAVSYSKGLAIIGIVLGHACAGTFTDWVLGEFHLTFFFFVSGYCFKEKYLDDFKGFAKRRVEGLYYPYIKWSVLLWLVWNLFEKLSVIELAKRYFFVFFTMTGHCPLLGGYWFLQDLFIGSFIFYLFVKLFGKHHPVLGGLLLLIISMVLSRWHLALYVYINAKQILASFFIYCGYLYRRTEERFEVDWKWWLTSVILVFVSVLGWKGSINEVDNWQVLLPCVLAGLPMSVTMLSVCKTLEKKNIGAVGRYLKLVGDNSLTLLTWHFPAFMLVSLLIVGVYGLPFERALEMPIIYDYQSEWWWIYFIIGVMVTSGLAYCNKLIKNRWLKL